MAFTTKTTEHAGSVRVDLLGGTLDIKPINYILPQVVTLNLATSLKAKVKIENIDANGVEIISKDYGTTNFFNASDITDENLRSGFFGPLRFAMEIAKLLGATKGLRISLESGSPAGAGLGGSSVMGMTIFQAIARHKNVVFERLEALTMVGNIEAKILECGPTGYQDYYPAIYGGVLALFPEYNHVKIEQLYNDEMKNFLESHLTLVYSGQTRLSGINNWEVYKSFFDEKDGTTRKGLEKIAGLSFQAYQCLKDNNFQEFLGLIKQEGEQRVQLFKGILSPEMKKVYNELAELFPGLGQKVCGAGGGGCFLLIHESDQAIALREEVQKHGMKVLEFHVDQPL